MYPYPPLRSLDTDRIRSYVRFHNVSNRKVDIVWVNFSGDYVLYQSLEEGQYIDINTYKDHPWISFDHNTKDRMHLNKKFVYEPQTSREYFEERYPNYRIRDLETRIPVKITLPLYSLRYCVLLDLKNYFKEPEEVDCLDLPKPLIEDLKKIILDRNNHRTVPLMRVP